MPVGSMADDQRQNQELAAWLSWSEQYRTALSKRIAWGKMPTVAGGVVVLIYCALCDKPNDRTFALRGECVHCHWTIETDKLVASDPTSKARTVQEKRKVRHCSNDYSRFTRTRGRVPTGTV